MSSRHRSRSRSPTHRSSRHSRHHRDDEHDRDRTRTRNHDRSRERDEDDRTPKPLPHAAPQLSESDYFLRNTEFRKWLKDEKHRYFDELSGEKARSYFAKFVKAWNRGKLPKSYYSGTITSTRQHAADQTGYKWSFASKKSSAEDAAIGAARRAVEAATKGGDTGVDESDAPPGPSASTSTSTKPHRAPIGPTLPTSSSELTLLRESQHSQHLASLSLSRKRTRLEDKERVEELVGPREGGREGMLEKKRVRREAERSYKEGKEEGFGEVEEGVLMGAGDRDSFQARIAQRDAAKKRFEEKRAAARGERDSDVKERQDAMRQKERATMDMFKQMAKERFGG